MLKEYERNGWWWLRNDSRYAIIARQIKNTKYGCPGWEYLVMHKWTGKLHRFIARGYGTALSHMKDIIESLKARDEQ